MWLCHVWHHVLDSMGHVWYEYPCVAHGNAFCYAMRGITFLFYVPRVVRAPTRGTNPNLALTIVRTPAPTPTPDQ